jgi:hypothetical protein
MRRVALVLLSIIVGCTGRQPAPHEERFENLGRIQAAFLPGNVELEGADWVKMVEWRASDDQCAAPDDCGLSVDALRSGQYWNPGRWIAVPPPVEGWIEPGPVEVLVRANELTSFRVEYRRARDPQPVWEEGLFGREEAEFPIGLGLVFENVWRQVVGREYVAVYAGAHTDADTLEPTSDGVVLVAVIDPATWGHEFFQFESPIPGPIRIGSVNGHRLVVISPSGERAVFDVDTRAFL